MSRSDEQTILTLAANQHGVVSRAQLLRAGVPPHVLDNWLRKKWLRPLHRGVYVVGPLIVARAREMSAVLACGPTALVSHWSAGALWQAVPSQAESAAVDINCSVGDHRRRPRIRVHRAIVQSHEATKLDGIPITTPARTLFDLAHSATLRDCERAVGQALSLGLTTDKELRRLLANYRSRPGSRRLRQILDGGPGQTLTRSEAEERFLSLIRKAKLPVPALNTAVCGYRLDAYWPLARLAVEIDGFAFHSSASRFESDRRRDAELAAGGVRVMRVTWRQLKGEPHAVVARVAQALAHVKSA